MQKMLEDFHEEVMGIVEERMNKYNGQWETKDKQVTGCNWKIVHISTKHSERISKQQSLWGSKHHFRDISKKKKNSVKNYRIKTWQAEIADRELAIEMWSYEEKTERNKDNKDAISSGPKNHQRKNENGTKQCMKVRE